MRIDKHNPCTHCGEARLRFKLEFIVLSNILPVRYVFCRALRGALQITRKGHRNDPPVADTDGFAPEDGEKLVPAEDLDLVFNDGLVGISLTDSNGKSQQLQLKLR